MILQFHWAAFNSHQGPGWEGNRVLQPTKFKGPRQLDLMAPLYDYGSYQSWHQLTCIIIIEYHIYIYICVHRYIDIWICIYGYVCMYICMYVRTYVRRYVCMYVYMYVRTYVGMYVCMYKYMYISPLYSACSISSSRCSNHSTWMKRRIMFILIHMPSLSAMPSSSL